LVIDGGSGMEAGLAHRVESCGSGRQGSAGCCAAAEIGSIKKKQRREEQNRARIKIDAFCFIGSLGKSFEGQISAIHRLTMFEPNKPAL
jgi:hypothetical protein